MMKRYADARHDVFPDGDPEAQRLINEQTAHQVFDTVKRIMDESVGVEVCLIIGVVSRWIGGQRWARNRASLTSDRRDVGLMLGLSRVLGGGVSAYTNQIDPESLRGVCEHVKFWYNRAVLDRPRPLMLAQPHWQAKGISVWSDAADRRTAPENGEAVAALTERAEAQGLLSAGYIETLSDQWFWYKRDDWGRETLPKGRATAVQCSATVRHPKGTGSGWAGSSSFDLARIDMKKIGALAFDKCLKSLDPVRIEPGRYQTILEPQAVATFAIELVHAMYRTRAETTPGHPLWIGYDRSLRRGRSKLGLRIVDQRLNISHDPEDPISGTHPFPSVRPIQYVKNGILTAMWQDYRDSLIENDRLDVDRSRSSFVMTGTQTTSMDEMISTMKRGLLVTRVSLDGGVDGPSMLYTGVTRDGLWLIENGKITKAVRNFRWTESPLFIFNNVESIGEAVPIFSPDGVAGFSLYSLGDAQDASKTIVVPPLKVNDFSFTSTIDAI